MKKNRKRDLFYFGCLIALVWPSQLLAQVDEIKRQINEIKMDKRYVYGEASDEDETVAYYNAMNDLRATMELIMGVQKYDTTVFEQAQTLSYDRGVKKRVFVYILISQPPTLEGTAIEEIVINNLPNSTEGKVEIAQKPDETNPSVIVSEEIYSDIILNIMEREMIDDVYRYLESQKKKGTILAFDVAKCLAEIPDNSFLVIYNKSYTVVSFLSPVKAGHRVNLHTKLIDDTRNYSGHGVLWFNPSY